jgi:hypothetical protein
VAHEISATLDLLAKLVTCREFDLETSLRKGLSACDASDPGRRVGPGETRGNQQLNLAFVLSGDRREELDVVLVGQPFTQELEGGKVHPSGCQEREHRGKAPCETGGENATKGFALREAELFLAKVEHRRKASNEVETPVFDFYEVRYELRGQRAVRADEARDAREKVVVRAFREVHARRITR